MSDNTQRAGLGKVVYSVEERSDEEVSAEPQTDEREVEEAVEESFPASDPPGFNTGASSDVT
jgi:hypothetical protein